MTSDEGTHHEKFHAALFRLRVTPLESGETPAELFMGRPLRTHLDIYKPTIPDINLAVQPPPELVHHLPLGARVQARNYSTSGKWRYGTIVECLGRLHYLVELDEGYTIKRHIDQLQLCEIPLTKNALDQSSPIVTLKIPDFRPRQQLYSNQQDVPVSGQEYCQPTDMNTDLTQHALQPPQNADMQQRTPMSTTGVVEQQVDPSSRAQDQPRRSNRERRPVNKLNL
ncbi:uncharacterized protein LOC111045562 [Nilaparvata lugens]|uniref:uncharacterized protein LOC111045562 n=1 Tax=Nilaparvata lugens TaxID=108931 RepID=UPI000B9805A7|nr:uncharacterized protein LOC111045562 [Nilaparvata lugens]